MNGHFTLAKHLKDHWNQMREFITADYNILDETERKQKTAEVRKLSAVAAAAIVPIPIPFADIWTITPIQIIMVRAIGNIHGHRPSVKTAIELITVVGGGWLGRQTFLALLKIGLPVAGGLVGVGVAYYWTLGMGKAAELYYLSGMKSSKLQMKAVVEEEIKRNSSIGEPKTLI